MKSKGLTYGLLILVGIIWYQVFIRVKSNFSNEEAISVQQNAPIFQKNIRKPKSFGLKANYPDPFHTGGAVKRQIQTQIINPGPPPKNKSKLKQKENSVYWPEIKYYGFVRNTNSKSPRAIVSIDGHLFKLLEGDEVFDNIRIVQATADELSVKYKGETNTFFK